MSINTSLDGKSIFDPSKRIKAAVGEDYAANVESEAIERLSQAMASNGIRKRDDYIEEKEEENNDMRLRDLVKNHCTHTNGVKSTVEESTYTSPEERTSIRTEAFTESQKKLNDLLKKKPFVENAVRFTTGFGIKDSKDENMNKFITNGIKNVSSFIINDSIDTTFKLGNMKNTGIAISMSAGLDFVTNYICSGNSKRIGKMFDSNVITATEAANINKAITNEKLKYALEHTAAAVVVPSLVKMGVNAIVPEKAKDNKIVEYATSFGVLSEIGKASLYGIRKMIEKKAIANASENKYTVSSDDDVAIKGYNDIAKLAINHIINESFADTLVGSATGTYIGISSVVTKTPVESVTSKAVKAFNASHETKPVETVVKSEPTKTASVETVATSTAKKSA